MYLNCCSFLQFHGPATIRYGHHFNGEPHRKGSRVQNMNHGHSGENLAPSTFENCMSSPGISPVLSGEADAPAGSSSPSRNGGACRQVN